MAVDLQLSPKQKRPAGRAVLRAGRLPDVERETAERMARVAKALGDPIRLQLVDVLRKHAGKVCVCELVPLFDVSQPTVSHHLKVLREAGLVDSERRGLWAYYYVLPDALAEFGAWVTGSAPEPLRSLPMSDDIHEIVRERYAAAAREAAAGAQPGIVGGCGEGGCCAPSEAVFGGDLYDARPTAAGCPRRPCSPAWAAATPPRSPSCARARWCSTSARAAASTCCSRARRVGPTGRAYGLDMTDEMLALARRNAAEAGATNVEFLKGRIEEIPLPAETVDVVISNCVVNLSPDKEAVLAEAFRVLRPGGRLGISDVVAEDRLSVAERTERGDWAGCIAGALSVGEYETLLARAGFGSVEVAFTHEVNDGMHGAIVSAVKPADTPSILAAAGAGEARPGCC